MSINKMMVKLLNDENKDLKRKLIKVTSELNNSKLGLDMNIIGYRLEIARLKKDLYKAQETNKVFNARVVGYTASGSIIMEA